MNAPVRVVTLQDARLIAASPGTLVASWLLSVRFQLIAALLLGIPLPAWIRARYENLPDGVLSYNTTVLGTLAAVLFGYVIYRKITSLPGTMALINLVPGFLVSYMAVAAVFFALRLDFSRQQFVLSFVCVTAFFFAITFVAARLRRQVYGFVPGGRTNALVSISYVDWVKFETPSDASHIPHIPIVADFNWAGLTADWERFLAESAISGRRVYNTKQLKESLEGQVAIDHLSENSFGHLAPDSIYAPGKFYVDFLIAAIALIFLAPLLFFVGLLIRLDSPGPAIFTQTRMGHRGKPFTLYKFRSMREPAHAPDGITADMTQTDDYRITRLGRFIRKTRIDELPQIYNILRGEMSWIGPRPETIGLSEMYEEQIPFYRYRHIVRPGITGWAQVKQGHVTSVTDVREKLEFDFYYVRNFSIWLDILIMVQTVRVIVSGSGAK